MRVSVIGLVFFTGIGSQTSARADIADRTLDLSQSYGACLSSTQGDAKKLACYDALANIITELTQAVAESVLAGGVNCDVDGFTVSMRGRKSYVSGSLTCPSGRLDYRVYDAVSADFIESGFTYFQGYAFQFYGDSPNYPKSISLKYTVSAR